MRAAHKDKVVSGEGARVPKPQGCGRHIDWQMTAHAHTRAPTVSTEGQGCHSYLLSVAFPSTSSLFHPSLPPPSSANLFQSIVITWKKSKIASAHISPLARSQTHTHTHTGWDGVQGELGRLGGEKEVK